MRALVAHDLGYDAGGRTILDAVSMQAGAGRLFGVIGPSGAGKSTLLGMLASLLAPARGAVRLDDAPVVPGDAELRRRMGVVLQGYGLVAALTGRENVAVPLRARGLDPQTVDDLAAAALAAVGLSDVADHLIEDLSGGQQQRVAVARALAGMPDVVIADEPTAELDADNRAVVLDLLAAAAERGAIVVAASHDPELAERCVDQLHLDPRP